MSGAFPISTSKFETLGIKSIKILLFQNLFQEKNYQDKYKIKDLVLQQEL